MQDNALEFMPKGDKPLPQTTVEQYIKNDFQFAQELQTVIIDGKAYLADKTGDLLNAQRQMPESEFINDWLDQFSLGRVGKRSYMNFDEWLKMTNQGTEAVLVVDDQDPSKVIFVIPPLAIPRFTNKEHAVLSTAGKRMSEAKFAHEQKDNFRATQIFSAATQLIEDGIDGQSSHVSDYIPVEYFAKFGIIPPVKQNLIYSRDYFGLNPDIRDDWNFAEQIFTDIYYHRQLTKQQVRFMEILTEGKWSVPVYQGEAPALLVKEQTNKVLPSTPFKESPQPGDKEYDPFAG